MRSLMLMLPVLMAVESADSPVHAQVPCGAVWFSNPAAPPSFGFDWQTPAVEETHNCADYAFGYQGSGSNTQFNIGPTYAYYKQVPPLPLNTPESAPNRLGPDAIGGPDNVHWFREQWSTVCAGRRGRLGYIRRCIDTRAPIEQPTRSQLIAELDAMSAKLISAVESKAHRVAGAEEVVFLGQTLPPGSIPPPESGIETLLIAAYVGWLPTGMTWEWVWNSWGIPTRAQFIVHTPDFHFSRRNGDGTWSDKPGHGRFRELLSEHDPRVIDPADNDISSYDHFIGYFAAYSPCVVPERISESRVGEPRNFPLIDEVTAVSNSGTQTAAPVVVSALTADLEVISQLIESANEIDPFDPSASRNGGTILGPTSLLPSNPLWNDSQYTRISISDDGVQIETFEDPKLDPTATYWLGSNTHMVEFTIGLTSSPTSGSLWHHPARLPSTEVRFCDNDSRRLIDLTANSEFLACTIEHGDLTREIAIFLASGGEWVDTLKRIVGPAPPLFGQLQWGQSLAIVGSELVVAGESGIDTYDLYEPDPAGQPFPIPGGVGQVLALDGERVAACQEGTDVFILVRQNADWLIQQQLPATSEVGSGFGRSIALSPSGSRLVVCGSGGAVVYDRNGDSWVESGTATVSGTSSLPYSGSEIIFADETRLLFSVPSFAAQGVYRAGAVVLLQELAPGFWIFAGRIEPEIPSRLSYFGSSLHRIGDYYVIGNEPAAMSSLLPPNDRRVSLWLYDDTDPIRELSPGSPLIAHRFGGAMASVEDQLIIAESPVYDSYTSAPAGVCPRLYFYDSVPDFDDDGINDGLSQFDDDSDGLVDETYYRPGGGSTRMTWPQAASFSEAISNGSSTFVQCVRGPGTRVLALWQSDHDYGCGSDPDIYTAISVNDGLTWQAGPPIHGDACDDSYVDTAAKAAFGEELDVVAVWRRIDGGNLRIVTSKSDDGGESWSAPQEISGPATFNLNPSSIAYSASRGEWMATWTEGVTERVIHYALTSDGLNWSPPLILAPEIRSTSPSVLPAPNGSWLVAFAGVESEPGAEQDVYLAELGPDDSWTVSPINSDWESDKRLDQGPRVIRFASGDYMAAWHTGGEVLVAKRSAGRTTWSAPQVAPIPSVIPELEVSADGTALLFGDTNLNFVDGLDQLGDDYDLVAIESIDSGDTWGVPFLLNATGHLDNRAAADDRFPKAIPAGDGGFLIAWRTDFEFDGGVSPGFDVVTSRYLPPGSRVIACLGDVTHDLQVDFSDLNLLLDHWGEETSLGDVDKSGTVNFLDLELLLDNWAMSCTLPDVAQ